MGRNLKSQDSLCDEDDEDAVHVIVGMAAHSGWREIRRKSCTCEFHIGCLVSLAVASSLGNDLVSRRCIIILVG